jgi:hypothetical protein
LEFTNRIARTSIRLQKMSARHCEGLAPLKRKKRLNTE